MTSLQILFSDCIEVIEIVQCSEFTAQMIQSIHFSFFQPCCFDHFFWCVIITIIYVLFNLSGNCRIPFYSVGQMIICRLNPIISYRLCIHSVMMCPVTSGTLGLLYKFSLCCLFVFFFFFLYCLANVYYIYKYKYMR